MILKLIQKHLLTYPDMEIQDVCKLIYQSIFGGGHLITDEEKSLKRIEEEYKNISQTSASKQQSFSSVIENIGSGLCRISLHALTEGLSAKTLNRMFVLSARKSRGTRQELEQALTEFFLDCKNGLLPFQAEDVRCFLCTWEEQDFHMTSHSQTYRNNYQPAYRVIDSLYGQYYYAVLEIEKMLNAAENKDKTLILAIDGMAGSGKSTLGAMLQELYSCNLFHMDDYFLQPHQRTDQRLSEAGGNVDYERFQEEIYDHMDNKNGLTHRRYDCSTQTLSEPVFVPYSRLNIIEGAYSLHPYFKDRADLSFFMEISKEEQKKRIGTRNGAAMLERFLNEWIPMEENYFETYHIREKSMRFTTIESAPAQTL